jgi:3-oxoacyl-[acyl-carrier-protein] synthase III
LIDHGTFAYHAGLRAAREIGREAETMSSIGAVVYCQTSIDECNAWVPAPRLARDLQIKDPACFSLNGASSCVIFYALKLIAAQMAISTEMNSALAVAADKWMYPFVRTFGELGVQGDGAGALLIEREPRRGDVAVLSVELAPPDAAVRLFGPEPLSFEVSSAVDRVTAFLEDACRRAGLSLADVTFVLPPSGPRRLIERVHERLPTASGVTFAEPGGVNHSAADPLYMLASEWATVRRSGMLTLWWTFGVNGEVGCAILRGDD